MSRPVIARGVQSGDVAVDSGVVWGRADRPSRMQVEVSTTEPFKTLIGNGPPTRFPGTDFAKALLEGLPCEQDIFYRVSFADLASTTVIGKLPYPNGQVFAVDINNSANVKYLYSVSGDAPVDFVQGPDGLVYYADLVNGVIGRLGITDANKPVNVTVGAGADTLVLKISQDAFQGSAQYTVSVDGKQIGGVITASSLHGSGQDDTTTVKGSFATGTHTLTVNFLNDLYAGTPSTDRNLYVDGVAFNGTAVSGSTAALMSAGPQNFAFAGRPTVTIAPADANPVVNLSHVDIVATSGNHSLFIGGSFDTARLSGGTETVLAFQGHNTITTGAGNDTIRIASTGSVINAGAGTNHIEDSGGSNRIIMPAIGGFDDVFGFVLQNSDTLDFRPALAKTTWDGSTATLGNFLKVTMSGADATIALASTAGGGFTNVAALRASGDLDLTGLLTHAIV